MVSCPEILSSCIVRVKAILNRVTRTADRDQIRRILNTDRVWSIYALADLDPHLFDLCEWWIEGDALALVFTGIAIRPIFVIGPKHDALPLLEALPVEQGYLNLRDEYASQATYKYVEPHRMRRMVIDTLTPRQSAATIPLGPQHVEAVQALYATGTGAGVAFGAFQLDTGFVRGVFHKKELIAVAGVHVVSTNESVAGVGNVFTRADHRGLGLAQITTSAVTLALLEAGIQTIGLNVEQNNAPAIAAYEKLGYRKAFEYWEGTAVRVS